jgi:hypothetical protein
VLLIYQAGHAVATGNVFTAGGSDGHFPWCAAQLGMLVTVLSPAPMQIRR